jgi:hypothetical protein
VPGLGYGCGASGAGPNPNCGSSKPRHWLGSRMAGTTKRSLHLHSTASSQVPLQQCCCWDYNWGELAAAVEVPGSCSRAGFAQQGFWRDLIGQCSSDPALESPPAAVLFNLIQPASLAAISVLPRPSCRLGTVRVYD